MNNWKEDLYWTGLTILFIIFALIMWAGMTDVTRSWGL